MRIISGIHKGRHINPPKNLKLRPTTDIAKEGIFNVILNWYDMEDLNVLDLFSGTGSISYEFLSRGCSSIVAVEKNFKHWSFIKSQFQLLEFPNAKAYKADVFDFVGGYSGIKFDIIFADPPFDLDRLKEIPKLVFDNDILEEHGVLILEHAKETNVSDLPFYSETKKYGKVNFSVFEKP